jgi:hypothetical protein
MDWVARSPSLTSYVSDPRARHYWDYDRRLSAIYGGAEKLPGLAETRRVRFRMKDVVWDTALLYSPGQRWGSAAKLLVAPVVKYRDDLAGAL